MKPVFAWLFVMTLTFQWVAGRMSICLIRQVAVETHMDVRENNLSVLIQHETGIQAHIRILSKDQLEHTHIGYSDVFIFSREIDGETVYYTIDRDPVRIVEQTFTLKTKGDPGSGQEESSLLSERYFSDFIFPAPANVMFADLSPQPARNFLSSRMANLFSPPIYLPPPEFS